MKNLMMRIPDGCNIEQLEEALKSIPGVEAVHDIHAWAATAGSKFCFSCHLSVPGADSVTYDKVLKQANQKAKNFKIWHSTIQVEGADCHNPCVCVRSEVTDEEAEHVGCGGH